MGDHDYDPAICCHCGERPVPKSSRKQGPKNSACLSCMKIHSMNPERTLRSILRWDGIEAVVREAAIGGIELPYDLHQKAEEAGLVGPYKPPARLSFMDSKLGRAPGGGGDGDGEKQPPPLSLAVIMLAAALGIESDPRLAANLVGLDGATDEQLEEYTALARAHPVFTGDMRIVAKILERTSLVLAARSLSLAGDDPLQAGRCSHAIKSVISALDQLPGGIAQSNAPVMIQVVPERATAERLSIDDSGNLLDSDGKVIEAAKTIQGE